MTSQPALVLLDAAEVERLLPPSVARQSQHRAFRALASGEAVLPPRLLLDGAHGSTAFCYAARLTPDGPAVSKLGSVNPGNAARGLPAIHALVAVLDADTGAPRVLLDGTAVTTVRTAAASAVAVDVLARADAEVLVVVGTGVQARAHVRAMVGVRPWSQVLVVGRRPDAVADLVAAVQAMAPGVQVRAAGAEEALATADVVALCTTSSTPVLPEHLVRPGTTVVGVGSFAPDRCEVSAELVARSRAVVDDVETCAADAGPVVDGLARGLFDRDHLVGLGDVLLGRAPGRSSDEEIVVHTSVGLGVQDAAAAVTVLEALDRA